MTSSTGGPATPLSPPYSLRSPQPGDLGWIVHRQAVLYFKEYGWGEIFEGLVAQVVADFAANFDPSRERCWIADRAGTILGSVFLVRHPSEEKTSRLRLLYVEPDARGLGLGKRLVHECTTFARECGYEKITLWTHQELTAARSIYEREGYTLVASEEHRRFGKPAVGETWELRLERN